MYRNLRNIYWIFTAALLAVLSATLPSRVAWAENLIYSNSLESGFGDVKYIGGCYPFSNNIMDSPVRDGAKSLRVINDGTKPCEEPNGEMKHRAEIQWGERTQYSQLNTPYWFGFSIFVPTNFPTNAQQSDAVIVAQWMGGSYGPELSLEIRGGDKWTIRRDWSTGLGDKGNELGQASFPLERGVWTDWVVYRERSWYNDGVLKVWKNGQKVVDFVGPTAINYVAHGNGGNVKLKTGIYWGTAVRDVIYTLYFDNIRTAGGTNGYDLVMPGSTAISPPGVPSGLQLIAN